MPFSESRILRHMQRMSTNTGETDEEVQHGSLRQALALGCQRAATIVARTDVLIVLTGAGWSADSGLAVYKDVAEVPAYKQLGKTYPDLCAPEQLLGDDAALGFGFWGACFNDYRGTEPHEGYAILRRWRDAKFGQDTHTARLLSAKSKAVSPAAAGTVQKARPTLTEKRPSIRLLDGWKKPMAIEHDGPAESAAAAAADCMFKTPPEQDPYGLARGPVHAAFYLVTSNVDAHSYDWFPPEEVREVHGNIELWQCSRGPLRCSPALWRAPKEMRFNVDLDTMLCQGFRCAQDASAESSRGPGSAAVAASNVQGAAAAIAVGRTGGKKRTCPLRLLPPPRVQSVAGITKYNCRVWRLRNSGCHRLAISVSTRPERLRLAYNTLTCMIGHKARRNVCILLLRLRELRDAGLGSNSQETSARKHC